MIVKTEMGVTSVIRDVLELTPKKCFVHELSLGDYFEYLNKVFIYIGDSYAIDEDGFKIKMSMTLVRPIRVKLEYDYILLKKDGKELILDD